MSEMLIDIRISEHPKIPTNHTLVCGKQKGIF